MPQGNGGDHDGSSDETRDASAAAAPRPRRRPADATLDGGAAAGGRAIPGQRPAGAGRSPLPETLAVHQGKPGRQFAVGPLAAPATLTRLVLGRVRSSRARASSAEPTSSPAPKSQPSLPTGAIVLGALALLVVMASLGALAVYLATRTSQQTNAPERVTRLAIGSTIEAARSMPAGSTASLQTTTPEFFACAEYRDAPEEGFYTFEVTSGESNALDRSAVVAHGTLSGSAGSSVGCTVVRFDSGGPPARGAYTLWLLREIPGSNAPVLARLAIAVP